MRDSELTRHRQDQHSCRESSLAAPREMATTWNTMWRAPVDGDRIAVALVYVALTHVMLARRMGAYLAALTWSGIEATASKRRMAYLVRIRSAFC